MVSGGSLSKKFARPAESLEIDAYWKPNTLPTKPQWRDSINKGLMGCLNSWSAIVEDYSTRSLGEAGDKLPALAGIAHEYADILNDQYVAGLWMSNLADGLLWRMESARTDLNRP
jgi:hypothetical protein